MKKPNAAIVTIIFILLLLFTMSCKDSGITADSAEKGGTDMDKETVASKSGTDTSGENGQANNSQDGQGQENYSIVYHLSRHSVTKQQMSGTDCFSFNFYEFLDGGVINMDTRDNAILDLKDYPTSLISSGNSTEYYYVSSPNNPVTEVSGYKFFNWDVDPQGIYSSGYAGGNVEQICTQAEDKFPGGIQASPGGSSLVYLMTDKSGTTSDYSGGFAMNKFNPFLEDSGLIIKDTAGGGDKTVLNGEYNRQLFTSFSDFSGTGDYFYTIKRQGNTFRFVAISLKDGQVKDFSVVFTYFNWDQVSWNEYFPASDDFSYANFSISPDLERLVICKNKFSADLSNPCYTNSMHKMWLFNLEDGSTIVTENQEGYVSDITWQPDGQNFAIAVMGHCGCYPDYLDAEINVFDKNANIQQTLVSESKNKITNISWSPDGKMIAYDIYGTDLIGRLKVADVKTKNIEELVNTSELEFDRGQNEDPVTILLSGWIQN